MRELMRVLWAALLMAVIALVICAAVLVKSANEVVAALPGQLDATRDALTDQVAAVRIDAFAEIGAAREEVLVKTDKQLNALRSDVMRQVAATRETADRRIGDSLGRVDAAIAVVKPVAAGAVELVRDADAAAKEVKPVLVKAAAAEQDAIDSWDDLYPDVNAAVQSSNVVLTQVGQAALESRAAAVQNVESVAGITTDLHTLTTVATKPKSFWGKLWGGITVLSRFAGLL